MATLKKSSHTMIRANRYLRSDTLAIKELQDLVSFLSRLAVLLAVPGSRSDLDSCDRVSY